MHERRVKIIAASQDRLVRPKLPQVERWCRTLQQRQAYRAHIMIPFGELRRTGCTMEATYFAAAFRSLSRDLL